MCHVVAAEAGLCVGGNTDPHRRCVNVLHLQAMTIGELQLASPLTIGGHNARVTRCPQGHPLAKRDLLPSGLIRPCRICLRAKAKKRAAVLTPEQREARREGNRKRRAVLTPKQRETIRVYNRTYRKNRPVTPEQREVQSARDKRRYDAQTPEQRKAKLVYNRARRLEKDKR
jgi:hypothetical protein